MVVLNRTTTARSDYPLTVFPPENESLNMVAERIRSAKRTRLAQRCCRSLPAAAAIALALVPPLVAHGNPPGHDPSSPQQTIKAAPVRTSGANPTYPRLVQFPDPVVMARVNAALAAQEKDDRAAAVGCYDDLRAQGIKPDAGSYAEQIAVTFSPGSSSASPSRQVIIAAVPTLPTACCRR